MVGDKLRDTSWVDKEDSETQKMARFLHDKGNFTKKTIRDFEIHLAKLLDAEISKHSEEYLRVAYHSCIIGFGSPLGRLAFESARHAGFTKIMVNNFFFATPKGSQTWLHNGKLEAVTEREGVKVLRLIRSW